MRWQAYVRYDWLKHEVRRRAVLPRELRPNYRPSYTTDGEATSDPHREAALKDLVDAEMWNRNPYTGVLMKRYAR